MLRPDQNKDAFVTAIRPYDAAFMTNYGIDIMTCIGEKSLHSMLPRMADEDHQTTEVQCDTLELQSVCVDGLPRRMPPFPI